MPSLSRRRETDLRADRLESEIRMPESPAALSRLATRKGLLHCSNCKGVFEEESKVCPRCDRKDGMGHIRKMRESDIPYFKEQAIRRSRERLGL